MNRLGFVLCWAAVAFYGCPRLPEPDGCRPSEMRCWQGAPQVCSQTGRWTPADRPCSELGAVCCSAISPYGSVVYACVTPDRCLDGGTDEQDR